MNEAGTFFGYAEFYLDIEFGLLLPILILREMKEDEKKSKLRFFLAPETQNHVILQFTQP